MGRIVDRSKEHLGPADKAIIQARRLLLAAVKTVRDGGTPRGINPTYYPLRASEGVVPRDADWREILTPEMASAEIYRRSRCPRRLGSGAGPARARRSRRLSESRSRGAR